MFLYWVRYLLSDKAVAKQYRYWGEVYGDAVSYLPIAGKCIGFDKLERNWKKWEAEYTRRGYLPIYIKDFVDAGGYGTDISELFFQKETAQ